MNWPNFSITQILGIPADPTDHRNETVWVRLIILVMIVTPIYLLAIGILRAATFEHSFVRPIFVVLHRWNPKTETLILRVAGLIGTMLATSTFLPVLKVLANLVICKYANGKQAFVRVIFDVPCWTGYHWWLAAASLLLITAFFAVSAKSQWWMQERGVLQQDLDIRYSSFFLWIFIEIKVRFYFYLIPQLPYSFVLVQFCLAMLAAVLPPMIIITLAAFANLFLMLYHAISRPCTIDNINTRMSTSLFPCSDLCCLN